MPARYIPPPYRKPQIALSRTPSPVPDNLDNLKSVSGIALIVSKLPRNTITSACHHLQSVIEGYNSQHPAEPLVSLCISPGDECNPVDYVFASVDPYIIQDPRSVVDRLEKVKHVLLSQGLQATWKVAKGPDRTRRVHFQFGTLAQAEALQPKLTEHLNNRGCSFQCSFIAKEMNRITYDFLDRSSVDALLQQPPIIDNQTLFPSTPRYIQPLYGLEVAVLGVQDVQSAADWLDQYIRDKYGDVIASSRLAFGDDVYCVVFKTWAQTSRFLSDPFTAFDAGYISRTLSKARPALLYVLNDVGLPPSFYPYDTSRFEALAWQQEQTIQQMRDNAQQTANAIACLSQVLISSAQFQSATSRLEALQSYRQTAQLLLITASPSQVDTIDHLLQRIEGDISSQQQLVAQADANLATAEQLISTAHPLPPLPAPRNHP